VPHISIRCYAELNDFLPETMRYTMSSLVLPEDSRIRDLLQTVGIPLRGVDLILVNGQSTDESYMPKDNDRISLYPVFESFDISSITKVRERPLRLPRFVTDVHLGRLAGYLRMLGFDALYDNSYRPDDLIRLSAAEERTLLTKSRSLLRNDALTRAFHITESDPRRQLTEVLDRFDLYGLLAPFTRCTVCNAPLRRVDKRAIVFRIPPAVKDWCNEYQLCPSCDRIYWKGSHYSRMQALILEIIYRHGKESPTGGKS
jgi:uncharacterized protein with PIN domain